MLTIRRLIWLNSLTRYQNIMFNSVGSTKKCPLLQGMDHIAFLLIDRFACSQEMCILISKLVLKKLCQTQASLVSIKRIFNFWLLKCSEYRIEYPGKQRMRVSRVSYSKFQNCDVGYLKSGLCSNNHKQKNPQGIKICKSLDEF